ncbi:unnamed protein product [Agarophyton chilense]|eukprot:gb/GEZJ01003614.1/.p1 GENE.gb/GEZJ01003614.1/~~gb/GEZJ01003614.1/.p1  ORF type:complete len:1922 (-),score=305.85 gb/GEZJ01003614.1/:389-5998(-)
MSPPTPPPRTPSRYNLRRRPSTATPAPRTPRMLHRLNADEHILKHSPSEPRLLRSATKRRPITADPSSCSRPTPQSRAPSTAPVAADQPPPPSTYSGLRSEQAAAAQPVAATPPPRRRRPSTAPPSDRVLRSASRNRNRDQSREPVRNSSRNSSRNFEVPRAQPPSAKRLTARARAFLPRPLNSEISAPLGEACATETKQARRGRSRSNTRSRPPPIEHDASERDHSQTRSQKDTIRTRKVSNASAASEVDTKSEVSPSVGGTGDTMRRLFHGANRSQSTSPDFSKWLYHDLVEECKKNALPYRGKKDEIAGRLQRFHTRAAGALSRTMEAASSANSGAVVPNHQETPVSTSIHTSEREIITKSLEMIKESKDEKSSEETEVENKPDIEPAHHHILMEGDISIPLISVQKNQIIDEPENASDACDEFKAIADENPEMLPEPGVEHNHSEEQNDSEVSPNDGSERKVNPSVEKPKGKDPEPVLQRDSDHEFVQQSVVIENKVEPTPPNAECFEPKDEQVGSNTPFSSEAGNDVQSPSTKKPKESASALHIQENQAGESMQPIVVDKEEGTKQRAIADELKGNIRTSIGSDNEPLSSGPLEEPETTEVQTSDPKDSHCQEPLVQQSDRKEGNHHESLVEPSESEQPRTTSMELVSQTFAVPSLSKEDIVDLRLPNETPCPPHAKTGVQAMDEGEEQRTRAQPIGSFEFPSGANEIEGRAEDIHTARDQKDCTENKCQTVNNVDAIQVESTQGQRKFDPNTEKVSTANGTECRVNGQNSLTKSENEPTTLDVSNGALRQIQSRSDFKLDGKHLNEAETDIPPKKMDGEHSFTSHVREKTEIREASTGWKRTSFEKKEEDARTPDVIDLDAESDGNDDDDEDQSRDSNSDSNENSVDESQRPETVRVVDDGDMVNSTQQRADNDENKAEDTDEDNDEDEDEDSDVNKNSPQNDIVEFRAEDSEPRPMDVTFSEQGEDREGLSLFAQKEKMPSFKAIENECTESNEEAKSCILERTAPRPQRAENDRERREYREASTAEMSEDQAIHQVQEHSRMAGDDEEEMFRLSCGNNEETLNEIHSQTPERVTSDVENIRNDSCARPKSEEINGTTIMIHSLEPGREEEAAPEVVQSPTPNDSREDHQTSSSDSRNDVESNSLDFPDVKNEDVSLSSNEEKELIDSAEDTVFAQKGLIVPVRSKEHDEKRSNVLKDMEDRSPAHLDSNESSEQVDLEVNEHQFPNVQTHQSKLIGERELDDLGEFSESPLPSPALPRSFDALPEADDGSSRSAGRINSEDDQSPSKEIMDESETSEPDSSNGNVEPNQLNDISSSSNISPVAEDISQSDAEMRSGEEDGPSEEMSSRAGGPDDGELQREGVAVSKGHHSSRIQESLDDLSSDPGQNQSVHRHEDVPLRQDDEVICVISSDHDKSVYKVHGEAVDCDNINNGEGSKHEGQLLPEESWRSSKASHLLESHAVKDNVSQHNDFSRRGYASLDLITKKVKSDHSLDSEHDRSNVHLSATNRREHEPPMPGGLLHKVSQSASRPVNVDGHCIPSIRSRESGLSASALAQGAYEMSRSFPALNSTCIGKEGVGPSLGVIFTKENQSSARPAPALFSRSKPREAEPTNLEDNIFPRVVLPIAQTSSIDRPSAYAASHGNSAKRPYHQVQDDENEDLRPSKIARTIKMVEFVPMPTPESTIHTFGQRYSMNHSQNDFCEEEKPSSILDRLRKMQSEEQQKSSSTFKLPPLSATLGQMYKPQPSQSKPLMFRQGVAAPTPKKYLRRSTKPSVLEFDKQSFLQESRKRLEAHKRNAPSLRPSQSPFVAASNSTDRQYSCESSWGVQALPGSHAHIPRPSKRVTFQTENPPSKRRKGFSSR